MTFKWIHDHRAELDVTLAWQEPAATGASSAACGALVPATGWQCYTTTVFP